jgi:hypothetical protein
MPAPFIIPFNNNPSSTTVKTTSYTIPAGKYAQLYVECDGGGSFTINAVTAVITAAVVNVDSFNVSANVTYTAPATGWASLYVSGNTGMTINANITNLTAATGVQIGPSGTATAATGSSQSCSVTGVFYPHIPTNRQATFWVPTGTVISGAGNWKATVMEFNTIT